MNGELLEEVASNLLFINPVLYKGIIRISKNKFNIMSCMTPGTMFVLGSLKKCNCLTMSEIGNILSIPKPNVTAIVDKLIASGYVERFADEKDRRIVNIRITEKGLDFFHTVRAGIADELKTILKILTEEELLDFLESTGKVKKLLHKVFIDNHKINI